MRKLSWQQGAEARHLACCRAQRGGTRDSVFKRPEEPILRAGIPHPLTGHRQPRHPFPPESRCRVTSRSRCSIQMTHNLSGSVQASPSKSIDVIDLPKSDRLGPRYHRGLRRSTKGTARHNRNFRKEGQT